MTRDGDARGRPVSVLREGESLSLKGRVERIRYEAEDGEFQVVLLGVTARRMVPVVLRGIGVQVGEQIALTGTVSRHRSGELQVAAQRVDRVLPKTPEGVRAYLGSGSVKGIGPKMAGDIVAHFGEDTLRVLDEAPERLLEVPGVGKGRAEAIREQWAKSSAMREVMIFLQSRGISPAFAGRIHREYGARAVRIVESDPYKMARDIRGIGFRIADRIARAGGMAASDPRRLRSGVEFVLRTGWDSGHVLLPEAVLTAESTALLEAPETGVEAALGELVDLGRVVRVTSSEGDPGCYLAAALEDEIELASRFTALSQAEVGLSVASTADVAEVERWLGFPLAEGQRGALETVLGQGVAVLTGGPGTGKTTIVKGVVRFAASRGKKVALAAPTGRAAKRLSESTGQEASTVHRLLGWDPRLGGFTRGADAPLEVDLLVVDEASMLDQTLALALVRALPLGSSLVLVGDVEQLPSVGAGDVLADVIASGVIPVARLDRVYRQAGDSEIVTCAHAVRAGELPAPSVSPTGEFFFIECSDPERVISTLVKVVTERMPEAFGLSLESDIQCLTPMNSGAVGTRALNAALQSAMGLKGPALVKGDRRLHVGDKVMQTRNNYDLDVFNGDIGVVRGLDAEAVRAVVEFDGRQVRYDAKSLDDLSLAYAVTVHKSQGSEFRAVVLVLTTHHFKMLQRNLLYTAITRARERLVIIGNQRALRMAIDGVSETRRHTRLRLRLRESATKTD